MSSRAFTVKQKSEAIALATIIGAEAAGQQLGILPRTIRGWADRAGKAPADAINHTDWRSLGEAARSVVAANLAGGFVRAKDAAVIAAIATRNEAKPEPVAEPPTEVELWAEAMEEAMTQLYPGVDLDLIIVVLLSHARLFDVHVFADVEATCAAIIAEHGSFDTARHWQQEEDHRRMLVHTERPRVAALWAARGYPAAECWARAAEGPPGLDPETLALLAEAEAWLAAHAEEPS